jgi:formylglycine-generating enzyme required for sulfatase activity
MDVLMKRYLIFIAFLFCLACGKGTSGKLLGIKMVSIPEGTFMMGLENGNTDNTQPVHRVNVSEFLMSATEITQRQFQRVMGKNPSRVIGNNFPVENASWFDAVRFCNRISELTGLDLCYNTDTWQCDFSKNGCRLPTEAEWEYACRAGSNEKYCFGNDKSRLTEYAWYSANTSGTYPVGVKKPNAWGLYDMHGNVYEWCCDFYDENYYKDSPINNPTGPQSGSYRVLRGGSWSNHSDYIRSAHRGREHQGIGDSHIGFRVVYRP